MFDTALSYEVAANVLQQLAFGNDVEGLRLIAPMCALSAFTVELYLKCLLVDCGCTVPKNHKMTAVFETLPRQIKERLRKRHRENPERIQIVAYLKQNGLSEAQCSLDAMLTRSENAFEDWRYYYEHHGRKLGINSFGTTIYILRVFILERHPEWQKDADLYFRSTFPVR